MLGGEDTLLFPLTLMGGAGTISAAAHLCTTRFVAMIECGLAGKVDDGRAHAEALLPVVQAAFAEPNPSVFKGVLHAQGRIPTADVRLPLVNASRRPRSTGRSPRSTPPPDAPTPPGSAAPVGALTPARSSRLRFGTRLATNTGPPRFVSPVSRSPGAPP